MKTLLLFILLLTPSFSLADEKKEEGKIATGEKALPGYWAPDEASLYQQMLKEAAKTLEAGQVTKEELKKNASRYSKMMLMHFAEEKKTFMHTMQGKNEATYSITAKRPEKNEIDVKIVSEKFGTETSTFVVKGDTLTMTAEGGGGSLKLARVSAKDAPARIEHIKKLREKK